MSLTKKLVTLIPFLNIFRVFYYKLIKGVPPISYEPLDKDLLKKYIKVDNPVILEIGSNDGTHTLWFLEVFKNPTIYCFEPDFRAISRFKQKVSSDISNIKLFEIALSDQDGEANFYQSDAVDKNWDCSGSLREPYLHVDRHPGIVFNQGVSVKTFKLDTWCKDNFVENIDFIWMDVQGAEMDVFKGAELTLKKVKVLYTEYSDTELYKGQSSLKEIIKQLKKLNFKIVKRYHGDALFIRDN
jgi:FkbM family methyltransferase